MSELNFTHSNGNKVKLTTPDTLAADKTFKLPGADGSAGQFLKTDGNGALSFATATDTDTLGLAMADSWRLDSNISSTSEGDITSNWLRNVTNAQSGGYFHMGAIGSPMTESSGLFSFPSTGIYLVKFHCTASSYNAGRRFFETNIFATRDNFSTSQMFARGYANGYDSGNHTLWTAVAEGMFDVINTSTHKVKFGYSSSGAVDIRGTSYNLTYASFIRLGNT